MTNSIQSSETSEREKYILDNVFIVKMKCLVDSGVAWVELDSLPSVMSASSDRYFSEDLSMAAGTSHFHFTIHDEDD